MLLWESILASAVELVGTLLFGGTRHPDLLLDPSSQPTPTAPLSRASNTTLCASGRWRWEQAKRVPESEQLDQLLGSLAEAVKAVAGFTRVSGVPDYRKDWDRHAIYEVHGVAVVLPTCTGQNAACYCNERRAVVQAVFYLSYGRRRTRTRRLRGSVLGGVACVGNTARRFFSLRLCDSVLC